MQTAVIAVFAAVASLESGGSSNDAILAKNEAILYESRASDQWAYCQAKGVKESLAGYQAVILGATNRGDYCRLFHSRPKRWPADPASAP